MKIIISNLEFPYDIGCRLLKTRDGDKPFKGLEDIWNDIKPLTFKEIAQNLNNVEQRRIAIGCLGMESLVKEVKPKLIDTQTISKKTTWVNEDGTLVDVPFNDTYELYEVSGESLFSGIENRSRTFPAVHYVKCKDTSTDREYLIWVDAESVYLTNNPEKWTTMGVNYGNKITAIQSVAWTIQTNVPEGKIEKIVRQGDCILIKKKPKTQLGSVRHLTENEYRELLVLES
jgi:hypothetical protein